MSRAGVAKGSICQTLGIISFSLNVCDGGFPGGTVVKNPPANAEDTGSNPCPRRSHMPRSNEVHASQLLSLHSRAHAPQQERPPQ